MRGAGCTKGSSTAETVAARAVRSTARWESLVQADCKEGDGDETVEAMVARLLKARKKGEAHHERKQALQARATLNARKGFTHWLRVGDKAL